MRKKGHEISPKSGFTLIELSIVLVIIGLIVGGVLVGQDLINSAKLRSTISQIQSYETAATTFRLKYNGVPGDLSNASTFFTVSNSGGNGTGDGDGLVEGVSDGTPTLCASLCLSGEGALFWSHLSSAGLIASNITTTNYEDVTLTPGDSNVPKSKAGAGHVAVMGAGNKNHFVIANLGAAAFTDGGESTNYTAALTPTDAYQLDSKVDDGGAETGIIISTAIASPVAGTAGGGSAAPSGAGTDDCYDSDATGDPYSVGVATSKDVANCNISWRAGF